jgi:hypothetical protein
VEVWAVLAELAEGVGVGGALWTGVYIVNRLRVLINPDLSSLFSQAAQEFPGAITFLFFSTRIKGVIHPLDLL